MKGLLESVAIIALGSVAYYYAIFLPQQQTQSAKDINAIRSVLAPTPEQQAAQQQAAAKSEEQFRAAMDAYTSCQTAMQKKESVWLDQQCSTDNNDPLGMLKAMDCRSKAMTSSAAKQFECKAPW